MKPEAGTRVELLSTRDGYTKLQPGDQGTVTMTRWDGFGRVISVDWDSGSKLSLLDEDDWKPVTGK